VKLGRAIIHGFVLAVVTIGAVGIGFAVYKMIGLSEQIAVQVLVAGVVCVAAFAVWAWIAHRVTGGELSLANLKELGVAYAAAFVWMPILYVPLHFTTQGHLTSFGNILSTWLFQLPFNLLALLTANGRLLVGEEDRGGSQRR
jgi:hypothetical protein